MTKQLEFILHGIDTMTGTYMAWESEDCPPAFVILDREKLIRVTQMLAQALPDVVESDNEDDGGEQARFFEERYPSPSADTEDEDDDDDDMWDAFRQSVEVSHAAAPNPVDGRRFMRVAEGALTGSERELDLMHDLARVLLPEDLLAALLKAVDTPGQRVLLAVNPPPSCGQVPWELLPTGRTTADGQVERFLDVLDVVTMGPILGRDSEPSLPHPDWEKVKDEPAVYLVQPWQAEGGLRAGVLDASELAAWEERIKAYEPSPVTVGSAPVGVGGHGDDRGMTRIQLSSVLRQNPDVVTVNNRKPLSHLLYVGHMAGRGGDSRLQLADSSQCYGVGPTDGEGTRWFSASDLVLGTIDWGEHAARFRNTARDGDPDLGTLLPTGVGYNGTDLSGSPVPQPHSGIYLWPMPPRVGLVACQSGIEAGQVEPFGMAAAILEAGAELVMTTRWTMLTDAFFRCVSQDPSARGFLDLSFAVDDCLRAPDAVLAMNEWKRDRLAEWRSCPSIITSPLTWAGLNAYWAPDRSLPAAGGQA